METFGVYGEKQERICATEAWGWGEDNSVQEGECYGGDRALKGGDGG